LREADRVLFTDRGKGSINTQAPLCNTIHLFTLFNAQKVVEIFHFIFLSLHIYFSLSFLPLAGKKKKRKEMKEPGKENATNIPLFRQVAG